MSDLFNVGITSVLRRYFLQSAPAGPCGDLRFDICLKWSTPNV